MLISEVIRPLETLYNVSVLLYYIADRNQFPGTESDKYRSLLRTISAAASAGIDFIQLREKDLTAGALEYLARESLKIIRGHSATTRLLINSRADIAIAVGADGVHLTANDIAPGDARVVRDKSDRLSGSRLAEFKVFVSCHSAAEVRLAESQGADMAVLAPIFEKHGTSIRPLGLAAITEASRLHSPPDTRVEAGDNRSSVPVLALGGVTLENARSCAVAGASGIAAIRLFQESDNLNALVRALRGGASLV